MPNFRCGIDLVPVEDVREAIARFGDGYLRRVYTTVELADAAGSPVRLAACFAAKEAVFKTFGAVDVGPPWLEIETTATAARPLVVSLGPSAVELARQADLDTWAVSVSCHGAMVTALALGWGAGPSVSPRRWRER